MLDIGLVELEDHDCVIHLTRNQQRLWECIHMLCVLEDYYDDTFISEMEGRLSDKESFAEFWNSI